MPYLLQRQPFLSLPQSPTCRLKQMTAYIQNNDELDRQRLV